MHAVISEFTLVCSVSLQEGLDVKLFFILRPFFLYCLFILLIILYNLAPHYSLFWIFLPVFFCSLFILIFILHFLCIILNSVNPDQTLIYGTTERKVMLFIILYSKRTLLKTFGEIKGDNIVEYIFIYTS